MAGHLISPSKMRSWIRFLIFKEPIFLKFCDFKVDFFLLVVHMCASCFGLMQLGKNEKIMKQLITINSIPHKNRGSTERETNFIS